jgi:hypothetical protein
LHIRIVLSGTLSRNSSDIAVCRFARKFAFMCTLFKPLQYGNVVIPHSTGLYTDMRPAISKTAMTSTTLRLSMTACGLVARLAESASGPSSVSCWRGVCVRHSARPNRSVAPPLAAAPRVRLHTATDPGTWGGIRPNHPRRVTRAVSCRSHITPCSEM